MSVFVRVSVCLCVPFRLSPRVFLRISVFLTLAGIDQKTNGVALCARNLAPSRDVWLLSVRASLHNHRPNPIGGDTGGYVVGSGVLFARLLMACVMSGCFVQAR